MKYIRLARVKAANIHYNDYANTSFQLAGEVVFEDNDPVDTGLLDSDGTRLFRVKETVPVGFHNK